MPPAEESILYDEHARARYADLDMPPAETNGESDDPPHMSEANAPGALADEPFG